MISYTDGMVLELWVRDTGLFDGFAVYVNGSVIQKVGDQSTHKFSIPKPTADLALAVNFGGQDGGVSSVVNIADPKNVVSLEKQTGLNHGYIIRLTTP
jgi:hypothetical protein